MKKAVCISCTHHYHERTQAVEAVLREAGYDCTYITSDFHHVNKKRYQVDLPHCVQIPTKAYTKNISLGRIWSHIRFSKDAMKAVKDMAPDLLYVEVPPNSLCREAARYKKTHPETKLIFDIFDMWPESFPNNRAKKLLKLPFSIWGRFRNKGLSKADLVLTECDLFRDALRPYFKDTPSRTLYLCHPGATAEAVKERPRQDALHLCYLGSINNIIDIPAIATLIGHTQKRRPVVLHIIGDGETRQDLIQAVESTGATVEFHGKIYDPAQKQAIFELCDFGLNIMKDSVFVGLTMKSLDYFAAGLPIISSIEGDTQTLIRDRKIGIHICRENLAETACQIAETTPQTQLEMAQNALQTFDALFSQSAFAETLGSVL